MSIASVSNDSWMVERLLRRDRLIAVVALVVAIGLAWADLVRMAAGMEGMEGMDAHAAMPEMAMPDVRAWTLVDLGLLFAMWAVMMAAMMLPSATPTILLVLATHRRRGGRASPLASACFVGGYLAVWTLFSAVAAFAQWMLHRAAWLSPEMASTVPVLAGAILLAAGVYQWLPVKYACLSHCRSPLGFLSSHWREGRAGAALMGLRHGLFCAGCCWALMALLFVAGVMNLVWVAAIAGLVLVEKLAPRGVVVGRVAGVLLVAWGLWVMLAPGA